MSLITRFLILIAASSLAGLLFNAVRTDSRSWKIDPEKSLNPGENPQLEKEVTGGLSIQALREHLEQGTARFVDARKPDYFRKGHLQTAINIPSTALGESLGRIFEELTPGVRIIIYCEGGNCESSNEVFEFLAVNGFPKETMQIYKPGWEELRKHEGLIEKGAME